MVERWKAPADKPPSIIPALRKIAILGQKTKNSNIFAHDYNLQWVLKFDLDFPVYTRCKCIVIWK